MSQRKIAAHLGRFFVLFLILAVAGGCYKVTREGNNVVIGFNSAAKTAFILVPIGVAMVGAVMALNPRSRSKGIVLLLVMIAAEVLIVPGMCMDTVRITEEGIEQTTGFWFSQTHKGFKFAEADYITFHEERRRRTTETYWDIHLKDGSVKSIDVGDLWDHGSPVILEELEKRGIEVR